MSRTAILLSFSTDRQLQKILPPSTRLSPNQPFRTPQPVLEELATSSGASTGAAAPVPGPSRGRGRPRARSPVFIAPATQIAAIEAKQKAREKKRLKEMERNMTDQMSRTLIKEGGGTVSRFSFQPEPEDLMIPPLRFTQVKNSWLLVPPTQPPLLPLTPLIESPPLIEPPPLHNPTPNFVQVRSKTNVARLLLSMRL